MIRRDGRFELSPGIVSSPMPLTLKMVPVRSPTYIASELSKAMPVAIPRFLRKGHRLFERRDAINRAVHAAGDEHLSLAVKAMPVGLTMSPENSVISPLMSMRKIVTGNCSPREPERVTKRAPSSGSYAGLATGCRSSARRLATTIGTGFTSGCRHSQP